MEVKLAIAERIATPLKKMLDSQGLVQEYKGKPHVLIDGWSTLGTMLGVTPVTEWVKPMEEGETDAKYGFRARVKLMKEDTVLAEVEHIATSGGNQKEEFAVCSMAETRATAKAYRKALGWIVKLAGYEGTPAEDMPDSMKDK